jgi:hypothetical protein
MVLPSVEQLPARDLSLGYEALMLTLEACDADQSMIESRDGEKTKEDVSQNNHGIVFFDMVEVY